MTWQKKIKIKTTIDDYSTKFDWINYKTLLSTNCNAIVIIYWYNLRKIYNLRLKQILTIGFLNLHFCKIVKSSNDLNNRIPIYNYIDDFASFIVKLIRYIIAFLNTKL